jgi:hypothetical protein
VPKNESSQSRSLRLNEDVNLQDEGVEPLSVIDCAIPVLAVTLPPIDIGHEAEYGRTPSGLGAMQRASVSGVD